MAVNIIKKVPFPVLILLDQFNEYWGCGIRMREYSFTGEVIRMSEYSDHSLEAPVESVTVSKY